MALKNQPQESAPTPEQTAAAEAAATNTTDTTNTATDAAAPATEEPVVTQDAGTTPSVTEESQAPAPEEQDSPAAPVVEEGQADSDIPLMLLGSRKGFPNTAEGNLIVVKDVVLDLLHSGALVVSAKDGESYVYFDVSKV